MATTLAFKPILDKPSWRPCAPSPSTGVGGSSLTEDMRNNEDRDPHIFEQISATVVNKYNTKNDGWALLASPAQAGTFGPGSNGVFMPHRGPRGTLSAVGSASNITLSTLELAATAVANSLADRGDGIGYKIRIIDTTNGKTGETYITANTASTTPQCQLSPALAWTPASGAGTSYEILSGRVYYNGAGVIGAGIFKYYDIALNAWSGNLSTTNLVALATDSAIICMDEQYVPSNRNPGDGIFGQLTATASAAGTLTGTVAGGDSAILANEFRNFQLRIITDAGTPASVGQRRRISSHTAGASPVYTINTNWTTTPSSSAVFVIEYNNDILWWVGGQTNTYAYHADQMPMNATADTWDTATYAARGTAPNLGTVAFLGFGISNGVNAGTTVVNLYLADPQRNFRYSYIFNFRGNSNTLDQFDIAGAATGAWTSAATFQGPINNTLFATGTCGCYDGASNDGKYAYFNYIGSQVFFRFNLYSRVIDSYAYMRYPSAAAVVGGKMAAVPFVDPGGSGPKVGLIYIRKQTGSTVGPSTELFESIACVA